MQEKKLTTDEFKSVTKNLLSYFDSFCMKHKISYFAAYGTLLGIIRHGGFIPWDDDIDVCMLREDYERFIQLFSKNNDPQYYILSSTSGESNTYYNNFARLCDRRVICRIKGTFDIENFGAFIDIFPLDNVPDTKAERLQFYAECQRAFEKVLYALPIKCYKTLPLKRRIKFIFSLHKRIPALLVGINNTRIIRDKLLVRYNSNTTKYVCCIFDTPSDNYILERKDAELVSRALFEDVEVCIPTNADKLLTACYGDYHILPPEEERYSRHHFTPYWREPNC